MAIFLGSDIFRGSGYGKGHPLNIPRVWPVIDICKAQGWLGEDQFESVPPATMQELTCFHTEEYIQALLDAEANQFIDIKRSERHKIGTHSNPIYPEIYRRPATAAKASLTAASYLISGKYKRIFNPSGGTHHGFPDAANGFCFVNDPAIALTTLYNNTSDKIAYIDIDAHHPDGVQNHFSHLQRIKLFSIHEEDRWPRTGRKGDVGAGNARNYPISRGAKDTDLLSVMCNNILPELLEFAPEYIVLQAGADGLVEDPQSGLCYSNHGYWRAVSMILELEIPILVLGGGGYNPYTTARAWAGVWALIIGQNPHVAECVAESKAVLESLYFPHRLGKNIPGRWVSRLYDD
ncbi:acetoin utilization protein AcuC [Alphaproteobacteria bacterium]|nr:acetoin utilization protein AcuC [Alphaproteobacteria bacterium]MBT5799645.1 acetoin utilization protein AcuC [Alphaproteobacteria bacterium]MDA9190914.1 acetoin utilization protein AcuC [Alphaproteobacteria bacterium]MDA9815582.1 acetoin utilization protein AcuC [Alphaproteobacteria bacterium]MDC0395069.1 acetoin utilization protein AcuC [Alphaproteobacteria bacterium]